MASLLMKLARGSLSAEEVDVDSPLRHQRHGPAASHQRWPKPEGLSHKMATEKNRKW